MNKATKYHNKFIAVIGPTASGKSDLALKLAQKYHGVIVCADSRQVYKHLNIGTNKPTNAERKLVPHYGLNLVTPEQDFSLSDFLINANHTFDLIWKKGCLPIVVGGTGLYVTALVEGYTLNHTKPDLALRQKLNKKSTVQLAALLVSLSKVTAQKIDLKNRHRVIRAIEQIKHSGGGPKTINHPSHDSLQIGIRVNRDILYDRINQRVDRMVKRGLINEVKRLSKRYGWSLPAMSGIGYKQIGLWLSGKITRDEAIDLTKRDTRHYAKRQMTWYRKQPGINWVSKYNEADVIVRKFLNS